MPESSQLDAERDTFGSSSLNITLFSCSGSSGFNNIDLTQENMDDASH